MAREVELADGPSLFREIEDPEDRQADLHNVLPREAVGGPLSEGDAREPPRPEGPSPTGADPPGRTVTDPLGTDRQHS